MEGKVLELAATQGVWALLTVVLIFYILQAQEKRDIKQGEREAKQQEIIHNLALELNIVKDIQEDINNIKEDLLKSV